MELFDIFAHSVVIDCSIHDQLLRQLQLLYRWRRKSSLICMHSVA